MDRKESDPKMNKNGAPVVLVYGDTQHSRVLIERGDVKKLRYVILTKFTLLAVGA